MRFLPVLALVLYTLDVSAVNQKRECATLWTTSEGEVSPAIGYQDTASIVKLMFAQAKIRRQLNRLRSDVELFLRGTHSTSQVTKTLQGQLGDYRHLNKEQRKERFSPLEALVLTELQRFLFYIDPQVSELQAQIAPMAQALTAKVRAMTRSGLHLSFQQQIALKLLCKELARIHMQQNDLKAAQLPLDLIRSFVENREPAFASASRQISQTAALAPTPLNSSGLVNEAQTIDPALSLWLYLVAFNSLTDSHSFEHCRFFFQEWEKLPDEQKYREAETWAEYIQQIKPSIPPRLRWELEKS